MKCINCNTEVESDDNFCPNCGHWTARGYKHFKEEKNVKEIMNGYEIKQDNKLSTLISLISISIIVFIGMLLLRGNSLFKPIIYLKKQITNYNYGYNASIIKTDNTYTKKNINNIDDAYEIIKKDFDSQTWKCMHDIETYKLEKDLEEKHQIINVNFCDISYTEVKKIKDVIDKMYSLFPNIEGALTNITVSNAKEKSDYIAYFQPMFQFVNSKEDINLYNKVNKTQILLNSYYFLNEDILNRDADSYVGDAWYVNDATWESTIAHELGHYITFKLFLKSKNIDNIIFININNENIINDIMQEYDNGSFASAIINEGLINYNVKNKTNLNINEYAKNISNYAAVKDANDKIIADETIAEAIHDYYLHGDNCHKESYEIVNIIKNML